MSCVPLSCLVLSCAGLCRFGLLLSWLLLSSSSVVSSCRVPCCLVFSSLGPKVLSLGASWKLLWCLRGELLGPPGALRGPLETDCGPLDGPGAFLPLSRAAPGPSWGAPGPLLAALGGSWASLGRSWRLLGRPKLDQKNHPKTDPKTSRIRHGQMRSGATPAEVSEPEEPQPYPNKGAPKNYLSAYPSD